MLNVTIKITGTSQEIAKLKRLTNGLKDLGSAMKEVGSETKKYYAGQAFASQGGVYGDEWQTLSPAYAKYKTKKYRGSRGLLVATGDMQRSFTFSSTKNSVTIGNDSPVFAYHQSTQARTKMPRRQMLGVNRDVRGIVKQVIEADIKRKINRL